MLGAVQNASLADHAIKSPSQTMGLRKDPPKTIYWPETTHTDDFYSSV
jgi:hypothetical protein